jgi:hypothetical protein
MPTIQVQAELSADDLLRAAEQLGPPELEQLVRGVLALKARRNSPCLGPAETELLGRINRGLPVSLQERYAELVARRQDQTLSAEEQDELLRLTDQVEMLEAERAEALMQLAQLRKQPLGALLEDLGIPAFSDG